MPLPLYGPNFSGFEPRHLRPGDRVISAVGNPWLSHWPWERTETVVARPWGRIVTDRATYLWTGREVAGWWKWWAYPRRITAMEGDVA